MTAPSSSCTAITPIDLRPATTFVLTFEHEFNSIDDKLAMVF
jgi:hypothetical protein